MDKTTKLISTEIKHDTIKGVDCRCGLCNLMFSMLNKRRKKPAKNEDKLVRVSKIFAESEDEHINKSLCLDCFANKMLKCLDSNPIDYNGLIQLVFESESNYMKSRKDNSFQEHIEIFLKFKELIESPNPDFDLIKTQALNLQFVANYRNRDGEYF